MENIQNNGKEKTITTFSLIVVAFSALLMFAPFVREDQLGKVSMQLTIDNIVNTSKEVMGMGNFSFIYKGYVLFAFVYMVVALAIAIMFSSILLVKRMRWVYSGKEINYVRVMLWILVGYMSFYCLYKADVTGMSFSKINYYELYFGVAGCAVVLVIELIIRFVDKQNSEKENVQNYVVNSILSIMSFIMATIIFISIGLEQVALGGWYFDDMSGRFSLDLYRLMGLSSLESIFGDTSWCILMIAAILGITIMAAHVMKKCTYSVKEGKHYEIPEIILGICSIGLYFIYYFASNLYWSESIYGNDVSISEAGYIYIIVGVCLIIMGLIRKTINNRSDSKLLLS